MAPMFKHVLDRLAARRGVQVDVSCLFRLCERAGDPVWDVCVHGECACVDAMRGGRRAVTAGRGRAGVGRACSRSLAQSIEPLKPRPRRERRDVNFHHPAPQNTCSRSLPLAPFAGLCCSLRLCSKLAKVSGASRPTRTPPDALPISRASLPHLDRSLARPRHRETEEDTV